ncbi:O-antigen ligase family protein [Sphingomonas sp. DT-204]|uniref:O-antigen ligase family protein n=1 Tax=Sphingomonas sp. DT-204 TaxID=3396166 RepID=UPI003F1D7DE6
MFVVALVLFGGSSRYDQLAHAPLRVVAILVIAAATLRRTDTAPSAIRLPALLLGAAVALVCIQLIPLPPQIWTALPGRSALAGAAAAAGFEQPWRPLAIAPDLALNSLLSLTVPVAALYGLAVLEPRHWRWVLWVLLAVVLASMLIGIVQLVTGTDGFTAIYHLNVRGLALGIFTNRNHQALLLAMGLPLLASWEVLRRDDTTGTTARWSAAAVAALIMIVLVSTGSRAGVLLGGLGLLGSLAVVWSWRRRHGRTSGRLSGMMLAVMVASIILLLLGIAVYFGRAQAIDRLFAADPLVDKRARALPTVVEMVKSYFPVGSGFGSFDPAFRHAEPFGLLEWTYFNQAHNDLVQVVLEGGAPALILLAVAVGWLTIACVRLWRNGSARSVIVRGRAASIGLLLMLVASAVDYPLRTPTMMAIASALIFQIAVALGEMRQADVGRSSRANGEEPALPDF